MIWTFNKGNKEKDQAVQCTHCGIDIPPGEATFDAFDHVSTYPGFFYCTKCVCKRLEAS